MVIIFFFFFSGSEVGVQAHVKNQRLVFIFLSHNGKYNTESSTDDVNSAFYWSKIGTIAISMIPEMAELKKFAMELKTSLRNFGENNVG